MKTFVIPDCHGNWELVIGLLEQEGIMGWEDGEQQRVAGSEVQVVQLGDLANCVANSIADDLVALSLVGPVIDLILVGNHEHPYFGGPPFTGFWPDEQVKRALRRLADFDLIQAAHGVDGILLTHAGVSADIVLPDADEAQWAKMLNQAWRENPTHSLFSMIGHRRGGASRSGGVLWSDWSEMRSQKVAQLHGHTIGHTWRAHYATTNGGPCFRLIRPYEDAVPTWATALCIDIGASKGAASILGAWIEDGVVRIVEYSTS